MEYTLLLYGDETTWRDADEATRARIYGQHTDFMQRCEERGHKITGGAELRTTPAAKTVRGTYGDVTVTDGQFAETAEQLGGLYIIESDDFEDLCQLAGLISDGDPIEIRPNVPSTEQS